MYKECALNELSQNAFQKTPEFEKFYIDIHFVRCYHPIRINIRGHIYFRLSGYVFLLRRQVKKRFSQRLCCYVFVIRLAYWSGNIRHRLLRCVLKMEGVKR